MPAVLGRRVAEDQIAIQLRAAETELRRGIGLDPIDIQGRFPPNRGDGKDDTLAFGEYAIRFPPLADQIAARIQGRPLHGEAGIELPQREDVSRVGIVVQREEDLDPEMLPGRR